MPRVKNVQTSFTTAVAKMMLIHRRCCCLLLCISSSLASSQHRSFAVVPSTSTNSIIDMLQQRWKEGRAMALLEQDVEDWNADFVASAVDAAQACSRRRLICQPLEEEIFDPPMGVFSHGHVQTGDKMSLPKVFWQAIQSNHAQVPWLFQVSRIEGGVTGDIRHAIDSQINNNNNNNNNSSNYTITDEPLVYELLDKVVGGPLDFRAPANYVFLPWWMMRALGVQPRDVVDVQLIHTIPPGSMAKLRPHSSEFSRTIANPQAVLETELRHYSSLTKGSTIAFDYNKKRYWFDVVELRSAPRGEKQSMIKVQDCDIATDFLTPRDMLKKKKPKKESKD